MNLDNMNYREYKTYHETYMANNHGSTAVHTFLCIFFTVQCSLFIAVTKKDPTSFQYFFEYIFLVLSLILVHTILTEYIYVLNIVIFALLFTKLIYYYPQLQICKKMFSKNYFERGRVNSISCLRSLTYLITVFCILAVDFRSFPRYLAKTENYGYSLMDTGVGLFVLMSGLVHKDFKSNNVRTILRSNIKFVSILLVLGVTRFISVKQLDYHEHVSEYGVHWNFFFTLAVCKILATIIISQSKHLLLMSILVLTLHECLLYIGLQNWVFDYEARTNLINANREGITSSLGYVSLYLFATFIKELLIQNTYRYKIQIKLILLCVILCLLAFLINFYRPASRTLANAGYCIYLDAVLVTVMMFMYFFEVVFSDKSLHFEMPYMLITINYNGLIYFLAANLMTGAINLSIRTLFVSTSVTFLILNVYMILSIVLIKFLQHKGLRL